MIGYVTVGVSDMDRACAFYDALLPEFDGARAFGQDRIKFYRAGDQGPMLAICVPYDENTPTAGNGTMVALQAKDRAQVDRADAKALELGATDEGKPGERMPIFYGAYVRDPDGNKLCFYDMKM